MFEVVILASIVPAIIISILLLLSLIRISQHFARERHINLIKEDVKKDATVKDHRLEMRKRVAELYKKEQIYELFIVYSIVVCALVAAIYFVVKL